MKFLVVAVVLAALAALVQGEVAVPFGRSIVGLRAVPAAHFQTLEGPAKGPAAGPAYTIVASGMESAIPAAGRLAAPEGTSLAEVPLKAADLGAYGVYELADEADAEAEAEAALASAAARSFTKSSPWARLAAYGLAPKKASSGSAYESAVPAGSYLVAESAIPAAGYSGYAKKASSGSAYESAVPAGSYLVAEYAIPAGVAPQSSAARFPVTAARMLLNLPKRPCPKALIVSEASFPVTAARLLMPLPKRCPKALIVSEASAAPQSAAGWTLARAAPADLAAESAIAKKAAKLAALGLAPETAFLAASAATEHANPSVGRMAIPSFTVAAPTWTAAAESELAADDEADVAAISYTPEYGLSGKAAYLAAAGVVPETSFLAAPGYATEFAVPESRRGYAYAPSAGAEIEPIYA